MLRPARGLLTGAILLVAGACGGASPAARPEGPVQSRLDLITFEEIRVRGQYSNLYDLVQVLRPRWLRTQGPDSFVGPQGQVQVHIDGNRMGGVEVLRRLSARGVTSLRWVGPIDAGAQFGLNHSHGAIVISTAPIH